ncbi:MAG: zinc-ribbon domain-containing protein [Gammaproteobacteria bacterium]|nr:zinc-ribbon domain-containing protein [Gammaproteobacteria bacterium]
MKTRCPTCKTRYEIDPGALLEADGLARCFRCGTVFETVAEDAVTPDVTYTSPVQSAVTLDEQSELSRGGASEQQEKEATPETPAEEKVSEPNEPEPVADEANEPILPTSVEDLLAQAHATESTPAEETESRSASSTEGQAVENLAEKSETKELPFAVPEDLEPLEPSPDVALGVADTLYEKKSHRGLFYGLLVILLVAGLGLQMGWQKRKELLAQYPILQPLCERIECIPKVIHAPKKISILQRDIRPTSNVPDSLTLSAQMRNDADTAQPLPDIQLSLVDNNGAVLIRRRLSAADYLFPTPPSGKVMAPGEVITITLDFKDPGSQASGFLIDFL